MKIRIKGNTVRFRLTKSEIALLCKNGSIIERTRFNSNDFTYQVKASSIEDLKVDFKDGAITLLISRLKLENWENDTRVGFYNSTKSVSGQTIDILLEKDFTCLEPRDDDPVDTYPNPNADIQNIK